MADREPFQNVDSAVGIAVQDQPELDLYSLPEAQIGCPIEELVGRFEAIDESSNGLSPL